MANGPTPADVLLRLSLVEGFTACHLARLARSQRNIPLCSDAVPHASSLLKRGDEALSSREGGDMAEAVREACTRAGVRIVLLGSAEYPPLLAGVPDAPLVLYRQGSPPSGFDPVAVVGSRASTSVGREFARALSADLALSGVPVVSGMARGIDTAAHEGALEAGGETIAVLGCGVDVLYPPEAGRLRDRILSRGSVVSEFPPGTPPLPRRFPARNRLISGMSKGVVVAEAPARSGALITARFALDQGREVMAVPGSPVFPHTEGSNRLLQEGAIVVTGVGDVLAALGLSGARRRCPDAGDGPRNGEGDVERRILAFLSVERHVNDIAESLKIPIPELLPRLLEMEFRKLLARGRGDYYKKMSKSRG